MIEESIPYSIPTQQDCEECGRQATKEEPNLQYTLAGMSGVLCRDCLNKELEHINANLKEN